MPKTILYPTEQFKGLLWVQVCVAVTLLLFHLASHDNNTVATNVERQDECKWTQIEVLVQEALGTILQKERRPSSSLPDWSMGASNVSAYCFFP
jgi:hypothetical protein